MNAKTSELTELHYLSLQMHLKAIRKAVYKLQMPPVMKADEPVEQVYGQDPEIANLLDFKFVFTDISIGLKDRVS